MEISRSQIEKRILVLVGRYRTPGDCSFLKGVGAYSVECETLPQSLGRLRRVAEGYHAYAVTSVAVEEMKRVRRACDH